MASRLDVYTLEQAEEDISALRAQVDLLNEIISMGNGPIPNVPASGFVSLFASGGQPNYINAAGLNMGLMGAENATFPGATVGGSSFATLASMTVPANDAEAGAIYELECNGNFTQGSTAQSLTVGVAFGGTDDSNQLISSGNVAPAGGTGRFLARVWAICATTGSSGTWRTMVWCTLTANASPGTAPCFCDCSASTLLSKDTTANQILALRAKWGSATGSPGITCQVAVPKRIA